jgi:hypothetical protein
MERNIARIDIKFSAKFQTSLQKFQELKLTDFHGAISSNSFSRSALRFVSTSVIF